MLMLALPLAGCSDEQYANWFGDCGQPKSFSPKCSAI